MSAHAAIYSGLRQLGIDQDDARDLYARVTGKRSLREMSAQEHQRIVEALRKQGFKASSNNARKPLAGKYGRKLQALWIAAWNLGLVRNRENQALLAFVARQTGLDHARFLHHAADAKVAIEALKAWITREGGVDWSGVALFDHAAAEGYKIAWAQWQLISQGTCASAFWHAVSGILRQDVCGRELSRDEWIVIMNAFGKRVRALRKVDQ